MNGELTNFILRDATNDDLNQIIEYVKLRRNNLSKQNTRSLRIGAAVTFDSHRLGRQVAGTVESIKVKNVIVATQYGRYRVPANMLTLAE